MAHPSCEQKLKAREAARPPATHASTVTPENPAPPPIIDKDVSLWLENGFPHQMDVCGTEATPKNKCSKTDDRQERQRDTVRSSASARERSPQPGPRAMRRQQHFTASAA